VSNSRKPNCAPRPWGAVSRRTRPTDGSTCAQDSHVQQMVVRTSPKKTRPLRQADPMWRPKLVPRGRNRSTIAVNSGSLTPKAMCSPSTEGSVTNDSKRSPLRATLYISPSGRSEMGDSAPISPRTLNRCFGVRCQQLRVHGREPRVNTRRSFRHDFRRNILIASGVEVDRSYKPHILVGRLGS
jgi:hypothetical protein